MSVLIRERQTKHLAAKDRSWWSLVLFTKYCSIPPCGHMIDSHAPILGPERLCPHDQCLDDSHQTCIVGEKVERVGCRGGGCGPH